MEKAVGELILNIIGNGKPCSKSDWVTIRKAIAESVKQSAAPEECDLCLWELNSDGFYDTECDNNFVFTHDVDNYLGVEFKYCPFCKREISVVSQKASKDQCQ